MHEGARHPPPPLLSRCGASVLAVLVNVLGWTLEALSLELVPIHSQIAVDSKRRNACVEQPYEELMIHGVVTRDIDEAVPFQDLSPEECTGLLDRVDISVEVANPCARTVGETDDTVQSISVEHVPINDSDMRVAPERPHYPLHGANVCEGIIGIDPPNNVASAARESGDQGIALPFIWR
jgi:hypothetical protein